METFNCPFNESCANSTKAYLNNEQDKPFSFFATEYAPSEYFWGKLSSEVLYVGVNPFGDNIGENTYFPIELLRHRPGLNSYFGTIQKWYPYLYNAIGKENGVAFTDLVKCSSGKFPIDHMAKNDFDAVFKNCRTHLQSLIRQMAEKNLQTIIVSGVHPCWHMLDMYFPDENNRDPKIDNVCKTTVIDGKQINVVFFRQFMGRTDVALPYRAKATELLSNVLSS